MSHRKVSSSDRLFVLLIMVLRWFVRVRKYRLDFGWQLMHLVAFSSLLEVLHGLFCECDLFGELF